MRSPNLEVVGDPLALPIAKTRGLTVSGAALFLFTLGLKRFFVLYLGIAASFCFVEGALSFGRKGFFH